MSKLSCQIGWMILLAMVLSAFCVTASRGEDSKPPVRTDIAVVAIVDPNAVQTGSKKYGPAFADQALAESNNRRSSNQVNRDLQTALSKYQRMADKQSEEAKELQKTTTELSMTSGELGKVRSELETQRRDLQYAFNRELAKAIETVAERERIDLVLRTDSQILFHSKRIDITEKVLQALNDATSETK